ncbi:MAG TPA: outer membrane protein assembly factor BamD [Bryobacteraceae bacterium]|jgi:outer membrane protein assembly factor BamD
MHLFRPLFLKVTTTKAAALTLLLTLSASGAIFKHKKYENPIEKDTQQPDKVLFDKAVHDIEKGRYEIARLSLNVLINTYDTSEFLAKAKLAVADSWFREGGTHGFAQAEAEYKDFILFYPTMEEAPEAQNRICQIHVKQMEKADRDTQQALRAEQECRQLLTQFPNSKFAPQAEQKLREIQEALADGESRVGEFYHKRGSNPAAANRMAGVIAQYPLYSGAADDLWLQADSYSKMGKNFRVKTGEAYQRIVRDYPLSKWADPSKKRLQEMEMDVPQPDPVAVARMEYEKENYVRPGLVKRSTAFLARGPDMSHAAKSGAPAMSTLKPSIPASVPIPVEAALAAGGTGTSRTGGGSTDVTISTGVDKGSSIDTKPDARMAPPGGTTAPAAAAPVATGPDPLPVNHTGTQKKSKAGKATSKKVAATKKDTKKSKKDKKTPAPASATPASTAQPSTTTTAASAK